MLPCEERTVSHRQNCWDAVLARSSSDWHRVAENLLGTSPRELIASVAPKILEIKEHAAAVRRGDSDDLDALTAHQARVDAGRRPPPLRTIDVMAHASPLHKEAAARVVRAASATIGGRRAEDAPRARVSGEEMAIRVAEDSEACGVVVHVQLHKLVELLNNRRCHRSGSGCLGHLQISSKPSMVGLVWSTQTRCTACRAVSSFVTLSEEVVVIPHDPRRDAANLARRSKRQAALVAEGKLSADHVAGDHLRTPRAATPYKVDNVKLQAALTLNGIGISKTLRVMATLGWACPSRTAAERVHRLVLRDGADLARAAMQRWVDAAVAAGIEVELAIDGAWSTRREANQCVLIVLWRRRPVCIIVIDRDTITVEELNADGVETHRIHHKGNYAHIASSSVMESAAWSRLTAELDRMNPRFRVLVTAVCVDRDGRNNEWIRVRATAPFPFAPSLPLPLLPPLTWSNISPLKLITSGAVARVPFPTPRSSTTTVTLAAVCGKRSVSSVVLRSASVAFQRAWPSFS